MDREAVLVENATTAPFTTCCVTFSIPVAVGNTYLVSAHISNGPFRPSYSVDIIRGNTRFRITYRVLRYPDENEKVDTVIVVSEPSAGVFDASTPNTAWIEILSVGPKPAP